MKRDIKRWNEEAVRGWEHDEATSLRVSRHRAKVLPASKVAGDLSRRDPIEDAQIFQSLLTSSRAGNAVVLGRGRRPSVIKGYLDFPELAEGEEDERGRTKHVIWTPDWTHTGNRLKLLSFASVVAGEHSYAMTIKLGRDVIDQGLKSRRGFSGYLTERMLRHLRNAGETEQRYAFIIEGSPLHELHLHGVIHTDLPKPDLRAALKLVGGGNDLVAKERQVDTKPITDLPMWIRYITKAPLVTARTMAYERVKQGAAPRSGGLLGATRAVRSDGAIWFQAARKTGIPIN